MAKKIRLTSPKGVAKYPWLTKPQTKFNPEGVFTVKLLLTPEEAETFKAEIDGYVAESFKVACDEHPKDKKKIKQVYPYEMETDNEGEETGLIEFKFKKNASYKDKDTNEIVRTAITFFDAKGKPLTVNSVFGGSIIRVNANIAPYYMKGEAGVTMYINAVQIVKAGAGGDGASYGFGDEGSEESDDNFEKETDDGKENPDF